MHCPRHELQKERTGRTSTARSFTFQIDLGRSKFIAACCASWAEPEDLLMFSSSTGGARAWCFGGWLWCRAESVRCCRAGEMLFVQ